jgi:hypothetical protein
MDNTKSKYPPSVIIVVAMVLAVLGTIACLKFPSYTQKGDGTLKANFHGFTVEDIQSYVEKHLKEKDHVALAATVIVMTNSKCVAFTDGDFAVSFEASVVMPSPGALRITERLIYDPPASSPVERASQPIRQITGTLTRYADNSYTVKTSLDP